MLPVYGARGLLQHLILAPIAKVVLGTVRLRTTNLALWSESLGNHQFDTLPSQPCPPGGRLRKECWRPDPIVYDLDSVLLVPTYAYDDT